MQWSYFFLGIILSATLGSSHREAHKHAKLSSQDRADASAPGDTLRQQERQALHQKFQAEAAAAQQDSQGAAAASWGSISSTSMSSSSSSSSKDSKDSKDSLEACRRDYPELLSRADRELLPWARTGGISRAMIDRLWRCESSGSGAASLHEGARGGVRRYPGVYLSIRGGKVGFEMSGPMPKVRPLSMAMLLKSVVEVFRDSNGGAGLPDCDLVYVTSDFPAQLLQGGKGQTSGRNYEFNRSLAPLLLAFRKEQDTGTVAAPDWTFWDYSVLPAKMPGIGE